MNVTPEEQEMAGRLAQNIVFIWAVMLGIVLIGWTVIVFLLWLGTILQIPSIITGALLVGVPTFWFAREVKKAYGKLR